MPNWCGFSMMVQGHYDAVKEVQEIILKNHETNYLAGHKGEGEYCYNSVLRYDPKRKHMFRIFESRTPADFPEVDDNLIATQFIDGDCAWSVYCCMLPGEGSYYSDLGQLLYYGTNLVELSKDLGVRIEVFSEEPGMCFQEHYLIENGKLVVDESVEIEEKYDEKTGLYDIEGGFDWCFDQFYDDNLSRPSTEFCESMRPSVQFTEPIQVGKEPAVVFHDADKFYELNNVK